MKMLDQWLTFDQMLPMFAFQTFGFQMLSKPLTSKYFPNYFQIPSKLLPMFPKGLKDKVTVSLLRRGKILRTVIATTNNVLNERNLTFGSLALRKVIPKIFKQFFRLFLRTDYVVLVSG